jgi:hypothetical protein
MCNNRNRSHPTWCSQLGVSFECGSTNHTTHEHSNYLSKKEVLEMQLYIQPIDLITNF